MPKRTEIELSPSHWQRLSQLAKRRKKSVSQLIADAVDQYLQREQPSDWEERKRRACCRWALSSRTLIWQKTR
jgi:predicted transcriptional regulator